MICPAIHWCRFLSEVACQDMALQLGGFYDRGSSGYGPDRWTVGRRLQRAAHVGCRAVDMENARHECHSVVEQCFDDANVAEMVNASLCHGLSCQNRLVRLLVGRQQQAHLLLRQVHDWALHCAAL